MPEQFLYKLIYALISGYTELLPVSSRPHQLLLEQLTGISMTDVFATAAVRLGVFLALVFAFRSRLKRLTREARHARVARRHRNRHVDHVALLDIRVLKTAAIPALLGLMLYRRLDDQLSQLHWLALMLLLNGFVLYLPRITPRGNKTGLSMSALDSMMIGLGSVLGMIPGLSRIGSMMTAGHLCGVDGDYLLDAAFLVCIPVLLGLLIVDLIPLFTAGVALSMAAAVCYLVLAAAAFGTTWLSIMIMRYLSSKSGLLSFSFYSWGVALFSFVLYLLT